MAGPIENSSDAIAPSDFEPLGASQATTRKTLSRGRWVAIGTALFFVLVMGFLLGARSVQIQVVATTPADVAISGGFALPFGKRYLMRPGPYEVEVTAAGYQDLNTSIDVNDDDSQTIELLLQPLPGKLSVMSVPTGVKVLIDEELIGTTPLSDYPVEAGEHQLQLQAERYLPLQQALSITGRSVQQHIELTLAPAWAEVDIASDPAGANVLIDGEIVATTPATLEVMQGEHQIMLQLERFASWQQILEVTPGQAQDIGNITLQAAAGMLTLTSIPSGANVTLDGEFQGQTPLDLDISPGREQRLVLSKPGYRRHSARIELNPGASEQRDIKLVAQLGEVRFDISPANALLRIDGRPSGRGSQTLSLPAFEHSVEAVLEGHVSQGQRVTPRPGLQQVVALSLQTEREAEVARNTPEITTSLGQTLLLFSPPESSSSDFTMGASRREPGRRANEVLHPVSLRRMFYLQTTELTNAQFRLFQAQHNSGQIEGNSLNREHQPAVQISWQQATQFCNWLSKREGRPPFYRQTNGIITGYNPSATGYRLPSEAEWAWAARVQGETTLKFPWGDQFPPTGTAENYADNTSAYVTGRILNGYTDGHVVSAPVASFSPNAKQLYDLGGNVAEWVHDVYSIPSANGSVAIDPLGTQSGDNYVIRGASWSHSKISELRLSYRDYGQAGRDDVGFRLARYAD